MGTRHGFVLAALSALGAITACGDNTEPDELRQGGDATVVDRSEFAFTHPMPTLDDTQLELHNLGRGPFAFHWTPPQLGPLFNHDACLACHAKNGRGLSQIGFDVFGSQALVRASMPTGEPAVPGGQVPVPELGLQLQDHAVTGLGEVNARVSWTDVPVDLADGTIVMVRSPTLVVTRANGDPLPVGVQLSYRQAPPLVGMALLEAIPDDDIRAREDPDDADGDGISGRANLAWDTQSASPQLGRFGHKANVTRLVEQVAGAFANDMGLTNLIFPEADGVTRDVNDQQLGDTRFHVATLGVPAAANRDAAAARGRELFDELGCASCHVSTYVTRSDTDIPQLAGQRIHPYTDLLLHDLGDGLADGRPDFLATGSEWRTPPLWGVGLAQVVNPDATFLHDGRARTLAEAILWHGGEAAPAREAFRSASVTERDALLAFLGTL
ncbi:MAG TPA: di-heme oxidoredictase family protein [Kofleriaceae bacterium]|nr:di-heme oxidoredictase family protein [Kofleriaceae bacterium]